MKLVSIKIDGKTFEISDDTDRKVKTETLFSVVIGPNAKGKSRLLSNIANSYRNLNNNRTGRSARDITEVIYYLGGERFKIDLKKRSVASKPDLIELPENVISLSNSLYDKFPTSTSSDKGFYEYVGARDSGFDNEKHSIYSLMDTIQEISNSPEFIAKAKDVFDTLNMDSKIIIDLKTTRRESSDIYKALFAKTPNAQSLKQELLELTKENREQNRYVQAQLNNSAYLKGLVNFIKENRENIIEDNLGGNNSFTVNLRHAKALVNFHNSYQYFTFLRKLRVVSYNKILVQKKGSKKTYDILDSSSGEISMLTTFIRVLPKLKSNSLILIDEPEISLHPNWQIEYLHNLKNLLNGYENCHVIIATHSPYIVSDSEPKDSYLVKILNTGAELLQESPYCRSVEDILWNIFDVPTTRNYYVANDIADVLKIIAKKEKSKLDQKFLSESVPLLVRIQSKLHSNDPMQRVLSSILRRIPNVNQSN